jgi:hypothetical protein
VGAADKNIREWPDRRWTRESLDGFFTDTEYERYEIRKSSSHFSPIPGWMFFDRDRELIARQRSGPFTRSKRTITGAGGSFTPGGGQTSDVRDANNRNVVAVVHESNPLLVRLIDGSEAWACFSQVASGAETTLVMVLRESNRPILVARWLPAPPTSRWLKFPGDWAKTCQVAVSCALLPRVSPVAMMAFACNALFEASVGLTLIYPGTAG